MLLTCSATAMISVRPCSLMPKRSTALVWKLSQYSQLLLIETATCMASFASWGRIPWNW